MTRHRTRIAGVWHAVALGVGVGLLSLPALAAPAGLDGSTFAIKMAEQGRRGAEDDTLIFKAGKFDSVGCRKYGFGAAAYQTKKEGEGWRFSVKSTSRKEGVNEWSGTVTGSAIRGKLVWSKPGQRPITYTFTGQRKAR